MLQLKGAGTLFKQQHGMPTFMKICELAGAKLVPWEGGEPDITDLTSFTVQETVKAEDAYEIAYLDPGFPTDFMLALYRPSVSAVTKLFKGRNGMRTNDGKELAKPEFEKLKATTIFQADHTMELRLEGLYNENKQAVEVVLYDVMLAEEAFWLEGPAPAFAVRGKAMHNFSKEPDPVLGQSGYIRIIGG